MTQAIIYRWDNGVLAIIYPTPEALSVHSIDAIAQKDVPAGKGYKIIPVSDIPTDRTQRAQWTAADTDLTDGVGAVSNEFGVI